MEILSSSQLHGYETILAEITSAHEQSQKLKLQIKSEEDKVIALKLSASKPKLSISHVDVKVFNNILEIHTLYDKEVAHCDLQALSKFDNCKFYFIEIYVAASLIQKLLSCNWKLQICISCKNSNITKIVPLQNKVPTVDVIPVDREVRECVIETILFLPLHDYWNIIDLNTVSVNISYHFQASNEKISTKTNNNWHNLSKLYSSDVNLAPAEKQMQCQFSCNLAKSDFLASVIKNSYHQLDLQLFSKFSADDEEVVDLHLFIDENKVLLLYNPLLTMLKIKGNCKDLLAVKKYFISSSDCDFSRLIPKLQDWLTRNQDLGVSTLRDALSLYKNVRKLWL